MYLNKHVLYKGPEREAATAQPSLIILFIYTWTFPDECAYLCLFPVAVDGPSLWRNRVTMGQSTSEQEVQGLTPEVGLFSVSICIMVKHTRNTQGTPKYSKCICACVFMTLTVKETLKIDMIVYNFLHDNVLIWLAACERCFWHEECSSDCLVFLILLTFAH